MSASNNPAHFLVEIGTEELPPKALRSLSESFASSIEQQLKELNLNFGELKAFASPRRLAVSVKALQRKQDDREEQVFGPPVSAAYDDNGEPKPAATGFAKRYQLDVSQLEQAETDKGLRLAATIAHQGQSIDQLMPDVVQQALQQLPIPKRMRWGSSRSEFIRPVHWIVMLADDEIIPCQLFNLDSGRQSFGHRFHAPQPIDISHAQNYIEQLESAFVIADFDVRHASIKEQVEAAAKKLNGVASIDSDLLDEVTALVEYPVVLAGEFDQEFLQVPSEALISSMQEHQKYFPVLNQQGELLNYFITVSNIKSQDESLVIAGNERVIRPRLSDAAFFFNTDKKSTLESRRESLKSVVFQQKLGSLFDKTQRVAQLTQYICDQLNIDGKQAQRAAELSKADLSTEMVLEFSDLQGIAGSYYAINDGEDEAVACAIKEHYLPKFAGDKLPSNDAGMVLALADRIDTLVGIFGINQIPTGSKDPFALRRASVSILRLLIENNSALDLKSLIQQSRSIYNNTLETVLPNDNVEQQALAYVLERLRAWYEEKNISTEVYLSVANKQLSVPTDIDQRIQAVATFAALDSAQVLAGANKRVSNLLAKAQQVPSSIDENLFQEEAEKNLYQKLCDATGVIEACSKNNDYQGMLEHLATLDTVVDRFFDDVMVMCDDEKLRDNRLALLAQLRDAFLNVADISYLAGK